MLAAGILLMLMVIVYVIFLRNGSSRQAKNEAESKSAIAEVNDLYILPDNENRQPVHKLVDAGSINAGGGAQESHAAARQ